MTLDDLDSNTTSTEYTKTTEKNVENIIAVCINPKKGTCIWFFWQLQFDLFIDGFFPRIFLLWLVIIIFMFLVQL